MQMLPIMLGVSLLLGLGGLAAFIWGLKNHQFDDAEKMRHQPLWDDGPKPPKEEQ
ncbi:MAG: cbb3-type cytochrome oxidase assembly protein CcoS [bacterium]|nr:cbb3-type cytochrome oxidase assembly protein CcoS [bacterium]